MWLRQKVPDLQLNDEELVSLYQLQGDQKALGLLFDRYLELIYGVCMKYLKNTEDARDASIEIYEVLYRKLPYQKVQQFRPWLYVLTKNHCLGLLRKATRQKAKENGLADMHSAFVEHPMDEDNWIIEQQDLLLDCLDGLPTKQKKAIELFYFERRSYDEIAVMLKAPDKRIRSYMQNGRRNLKICLEKKNGSPE